MIVMGLELKAVVEVVVETGTELEAAFVEEAVLVADVTEDIVDFVRSENAEHYLHSVLPGVQMDWWI